MSAQVRNGPATKVIWFTDGENTEGCDVTTDQIIDIKYMDPDGVTVDLVKLGTGSGSPQLEELVEQTGGQIITVTDPADLIDALLESQINRITEIEALDETKW